MKIFLVLLFAFVFNFILPAQEKILKHCIVLQYNADGPNDLQKASFELPFFARREGSKSDFKEKYIGFHLNQSMSFPETNEFKVTVNGIKPYEYGQDYEAGELGFLVMEMNEKLIAFFPSINETKITTEFLIVKEDIKLPEALVGALGGKIQNLKKGAYKISEIEF